MGGRESERSTRQTTGSSRHGTTEGLEVCFIINSTSDADTDAQIPECNIFHPNIQVDLNPLFFCNNALSHCEFTCFLWFYFHSTFAIDFILLVFHITGAFNSPFLHCILNRFVPVTSLPYAHVLLTFFFALSPRYL